MIVAFDRKGEWKRIKDKMLQELTRPDSQHIANVHNAVAGGIIRRTKAGVNVAGMKFAPYKAAYAKRKGYAAADLTQSGQMLQRGAFKYQTAFQGGKVLIRIWMEGAHSGNVSIGTLASVHNFGMRSGRGAGFQMTKREFFGIDADITRAIKELSDEKWREIIRSLRGA